MTLFADQRLDGRVVIVTGSTQGLGEAIALRAAALGAAGIVICGRSREGSRLAAMPYFFIERYTASYVRQWEAFAAAVRAGVTPPVTGPDARAPLVIGLAALGLAARAASGGGRRGGRMTLFADQRLDGRVVIVTGSTQGLGEAIASAPPPSAPPASRSADAAVSAASACARASPSSAARPCSCPPTSPAKTTAARSCARVRSASTASTGWSTRPG